MAAAHGRTFLPIFGGCPGATGSSPGTKQKVSGTLLLRALRPGNGEQVLQLVPEHLGDRLAGGKLVADMAFRKQEEVLLLIGQRLALSRIPANERKLLEQMKKIFGSQITCSSTAVPVW